MTRKPMWLCALAALLFAVPAFADKNAVLDRDGESWTFASDLEMWDQGGSIWIETEEDEPQKVGIKMRNVRWPVRNNRDSLVLYACRGDEGQAVSYVWSEPTAERLAMNLRWMQASCSLEQ